RVQAGRSDGEGGFPARRYLVTQRRRGKFETPRQTERLALPSPSVLENFDGKVSPGPFFQVRQELRKRAERRMEVVVECRIRRHPSQRALAAVHLGEQRG